MMTHMLAGASDARDFTKLDMTTIWARQPASGPGTVVHLDSGTPGTPSRRSGFVIRLIGLAMLVTTMAVAATAVQYMRRQTVEANRQEIGNLGIVLAEQTYRYFQEIDLVLTELRDRAALLNANLPETFGQVLGSQETFSLLHSRLQNMAQVDALNIVDSTGHVLNSSRGFPVQAIDVSDRDYFRHFIERNDPGLFISAPVISRVTHQPTLFVARRINAPDGTFLGLVVGVIDISYFTSFYSAINRQPGQSLTLLRSDGVVLVRNPDATREAGRTMPQGSPWYDRVLEGGGTYTSPGYLGGIPALVTVHPLRDYPLVFDTSVQEPVALSAWRRLAALLAVAGVVGGSGFAVLFWYIGRLFHRQAEQTHTLQQIRQDLLTTLDNMDQGLIVIARDRSVPICNRRAIELLDLPVELMTRCPKWDDVLAYQWQANEFVSAGAEFQEFVQKSMLLDGPLIYDRVRPNGRVLEVRTTPLPGGEAVRTYTDITERKRAEQRVEFLAHHDGLTGLANRVLLDDRLAQALAYARRGDKQVAVLALDLDRFKSVNDSFGHAAGDCILIQVAERLRQTVRSDDTIARIGGDEFVIVQAESEQPRGAVEAAQRVIEALSRPFEFAGNAVHVGTSVGIAIHPADADAAAPLLQFADLALYRAKADGPGVFRLFEQEMDHRLRERRELERDLRQAVADNQLTLLFQPQLACLTGEVAGFEALLRWQHPLRGEISPSIFIPMAEETKLINEIGAWTLERACAVATTWPSDVRVAVNVSAAQFHGGGLPRQVAEVLNRTGLLATQLELEVTETLLIDDPDQAREALRELKAMGVHIALDDFGTGYSSLSYLHRFPFDRVKIDKSFVQALDDDPGARSIVQAMLAMARSLNVDVTAEGIETAGQLDILQQQRCPQVQGFLLGQPMPLDEISQYLADHAGRCDRQHANGK